MESRSLVKMGRTGKYLYHDRSNVERKPGALKKKKNTVKSFWQRMFWVDSKFCKPTER